MQTRPEAQNVTIIGAGLAGSLLAIFLAKRGLGVHLIERRPDPRQSSTSAGRSINLALSTRGLHALEQVGLADTMRQCSMTMRGRRIHTLDGDVAFQPYGVDDTEVLHAISRHDLQCRLLDAVTAYPTVTLDFDHRCVNADLNCGTIHLRQNRNGHASTRQASPIIGTDGTASALRQAMLTTPRFNFSQTYLEHGYKELSIPPGPNGTYKLDPHALHIWPRGSYMLIALPNLDGSFTCTLFLPFSGNDSFDALTTPDTIHRFFDAQFPDVVPLIPGLSDSFLANPTGSLVTIKCDPWHCSGNALLLGDAAHAIVPFFGQGMNCAFEDCTYLDACLTEYGPNWESIFAAFAATRKPDTDAIADMAVTHYIEMRDRVTEPQFILQKQIEQELAKRYPEVYIPQYSLVTFHRIPYAVAQEKTRTQEHILQSLSASITHLSDVDWTAAERLITQALATA